MGRIKTKIVKRLTQQLMAEHKDAFSDDYVKNKEIMRTYLDVNSRKLGNIIAGYITKLVKSEKNKE